MAAWEVWNEPNHPTYFKASDQATSYAALVKAAYPAAKAADPSATIIAGSLADADFQFTRALLEKGIGGHFDAYSVHPYSEDRSPLHPGIAGWTKKSFAAGVPAVREALLAHGQDRPIWLTEFGWSSCNVRGQSAAYDNCVDLQTQAVWLEQAYAHMRSWSYVPVGVWFNVEDTSADASDRVDNYGLTTAANAPKPAFAAFRRAAAALQSGAGPSAHRPRLGDRRHGRAGAGAQRDPRRRGTRGHAAPGTSRAPRGDPGSAAVGPHAAGARLSLEGVAAPLQPAHLLSSTYRGVRFGPLRAPDPQPTRGPRPVAHRGEGPPAASAFGAGRIQGPGATRKPSRAVAERLAAASVAWAASR